MFKKVKKSNFADAYVRSSQLYHISYKNDESVNLEKMHKMFVKWDKKSRELKSYP